jgi:hypothetical protein
MEKSLPHIMSAKDEHQLLALLAEVKDVKPDNPVKVRAIAAIKLELSARYKK